MNMQELQAQIELCKANKTKCLKGMATAGNNEVELLASMAEALAVVEIRTQVAFMYEYRKQQDPNARF